jgi:hypothetical protein
MPLLEHAIMGHGCERSEGTKKTRGMKVRLGRASYVGGEEASVGVPPDHWCSGSLQTSWSRVWMSKNFEACQALFLFWKAVHPSVTWYPVFKSSALYLWTYKDLQELIRDILYEITILYLVRVRFSLHHCHVWTGSDIRKYQNNTICRIGHCRSLLIG